MINTKLADRYEVVAEIGRGGMGVVYRARDPRLNRDVAVKLVASSELSADTQERFQREAQIVAQMDHPGIVPIHDVGRHEGSYFFVMPLVVGTSLRHLLWDGTLRLGEVLDIAIQTAEALEYSHSRGVVHRDIKPENIMVTREEGGNVRVRVMDFGLAHASSDNRLTKTGTLVGTVTYLSPEQVTAHAFDGRSDIYSLGTVLYECLAGQPPFAGESQSVLYRIVHEIPQPPRALGADIREGLQAIVMQCLEKDPSRRPQRAAELVEALRRSRASLASDEYSMSLVNTASRVLARPAPSAFIGREKEFAELQHRLNAAISGDCQFVAVAGEPGIGKTRLLEELTKLATMRKIRVLYGRFVELDRAFSYQGFCELVQDYFRNKDTGSSGTERPDFSDLAPDLLALFPQLTEISELRSAGSSDSRIAPTVAERKAEDRIQVFELIARTLVRIAAGKPLVLILENLHGAEVSLEALQYIVRRLGPTPTLIVGSYRHTETDKRHPLTRMLDSFADDPRFVSITLGPFSPSEHRALVESVVGASSLADGLAERVRDATEGNPFFTKELLRSLLDSGGIAKDPSGAWTFSKAAGISTDALPATIQQAVEKRVEHLPEELRELLSVASVLGRSFEFRDLETLAEGERNLDESAERLIREGILEEERESRGDRLAFSSGIVRDVLYSALSRRRRRSLHRRYAELIEGRYAGRLDRVYPDLVHHFSQADVPEKTVEYGLKLAQKSLDAFSPDDAVRSAKTALEYLQDGEWSGDRSLEGEARLLLAQASRISGGVDTALREAEGAVRTFERAGRPERAVAAILFAAETAWQSRMMDETSLDRRDGREPARRVPEGRRLSRRDRTAHGDGEGARGRGSSAWRDARRRDGEPDRGPGAEHLPDDRGERGRHERRRNARDDGRAGKPRPGARRALGARRRGPDRSPCDPARDRVLGRDSADRFGGEVIPRAFDPAVREPHAGGIRRHFRGSGVSRRGRDGGCRNHHLRGRRGRHPSHRVAADLPGPPDGRQDLHRAADDGRRGGRRRRPRHRAVPAGAPSAGPGRPRAQRPVPEGPSESRSDRVPTRALRLHDRRRAPVRRRRPRARPAPAGSGGDPPRSAVPDRTDRAPEEEHLLRALQLFESGGVERDSAGGARQGRARPGLRLGDPRPLRSARHRDAAARGPRARSRTPATPPLAREGRGNDPFRRARAPSPPPCGRPSDPPGSVRRLDRGALRRLGGARSRGGGLKADDAGIPRGVERERWDRPDRRALDRGLRRPGQLLIQPLPLGEGPPARLLLVSRDRSNPRRGAAREPPGSARRALSPVRARAARLRGPDPALPRRRLPDRGPDVARRATAQHLAVRQLHRGGQGRGGRDRRARPARRRRDAPHSDSRRRVNPRSRARVDGRAGRGPPRHLREPDEGDRGSARRSLARLRDPHREQRNALPVPAAPGRPFPRRPADDRARRPVFVRTAPSDTGEREPMGADTRARREAPRGGERDRARGIPHRFTERVLHRSRETGVLLSRAALVSIGVDRSRRHARDRRKLAGRVRRDGALPRSLLRAGKATRARPQSRLLARGVSAKRGAGVPLRDPAGGDPLRVPRRTVLDRVEPAASGRRKAPSRPGLRVWLQGGAAALDLLARLQPAPRRFPGRFRSSER